MTRQRYGPWLAGADDRLESTALCTAGVAATYAPALLRPAPNAPTALNAPAIAEQIAAAWRDQGAPAAARWTDPALAPGWDPAVATPAPLLAEAWQYLAWAIGGYSPRLAVEVGADPELLLWVTGRLGYERNAAPIVAMPEDGPIPLPWPLPLRVGVLAGPAGSATREQVVREQRAGTTGWRQQLLDLVEVGRERATCDLLVLAGDPPAAAAALATLREVRAQVVLVLGGTGTSTGVSAVPAIVAATGAWAVGLAGPADPGVMVIEFCRQLTHNLTADQAFLRAGSGSPGLFFARPDVVAAQCIARSAAAAAAALRAAAPEIRGPTEPAVPGPEVPAEVQAARVATEVDRDRLAEIAVNGLFEFEGGEATEIELIMQRTAALSRFSDARRYLRAAVTAPDAPGVALAAFRPGTAHTVRIDIGAFTTRSMVAEAPFDSGVAASPQRLVVVLTEPVLLPEPQAAEIELPPTGESTTAEFTLVTRPDTVDVDARIIVLSGNRVVQTARLPRQVLPGAPAPATGPVATPEAEIAPLSMDLADRRSFDLALVVDATGDGATAVAGTATAAIRLGDVSVGRAKDLIAGRLAGIVHAPDDFGSLDTVASLRLLRHLAGHGRLMADALVSDTAGMGDVLERSTHVQVTSAQPGAWFPFEFAYDFPAPAEDAPLCPGAVAALATGGVDVVCAAGHDGSTVCPFGFWGVNRVIERHASPPSTAQAHPDFLMTSGTGRHQDRILLGSTVVAASSRVDEIVAGSIDRVVGTLGRHAPTRHVTGWAQWQDAVTTGPSLLMLLPHTVYDAVNELYGLEIGAADRLYSPRISRVMLPAVPSIAVLLGCDTVSAGSVSYEEFPALLRRAGAKVVVATHTEMLGRHAAPMAQSFADELYAACRDDAVGVGEVMVILRRRMLARGIPAVLALTAFGDADWSIERSRP
jgi:hypothetical protein